MLGLPRLPAAGHPRSPEGHADTGGAARSLAPEAGTAAGTIALREIEATR